MIRDVSWALFVTLCYIAAIVAIPTGLALLLSGCAHERQYVSCTINGEPGDCTVETYKL